MKSQLEQLLADALARVIPDLPVGTDRPAVALERTRDPQHGDFATNVAMRLAKVMRRSPRELAQTIIEALPDNDLVARAEVAGGGFINFHLRMDVYARELARVLELQAGYGRAPARRSDRVLIEFVSANPTGPLHVGHGRQAAYGATLAKLLDAAGYEVSREYYVNDAGRQMDILAVSVWLRYLEAGGEPSSFPSNGYRGDYVREIAATLRAELGGRLQRPSSEVFAGLPADAPEGDKELHIDGLIERARTLLGESAFRAMLDRARDLMLDDIRADLLEFGISFDQWTSERAIADSGAIDRALERLERQERLYRKEGATWFRATDFGDEKDRVVVRENGQRTYFASDIAYHLDKRERGFSRLIDVLGADHHGYVARVRAGLAAMGEPPDSLEATLIQFVSLFRGAEKVPMGKREAQFVTLRQLRAEVGNDACRLFYLMRSHDQPLDFDLELAKSRTNENPVYYIQYAHARVASVMKQLAARGLELDRRRALASLALLSSPHEQAVLAAIARFPEVLEQAAAARAPHSLVHYLRELSNAFHTYYNAETFIVDDPSLRDARLALVLGVRQVIANGLELLGVSAPETM